MGYNPWPDAQFTPNLARSGPEDSSLPDDLVDQTATAVAGGTPKAPTQITPLAYQETEYHLLRRGGKGEVAQSDLLAQPNLDNP
jgi:hypothetical protein